MAPIKMQDGQWAYPFTAVAEGRDHQRNGATLQYTSKLNNGAYSDAAYGRGGWVGLGEFDAWLDLLVDSDRFMFRAITPTQLQLHPTLWQRIKGWFA